MHRTHSFGYWLRRRRKALDLTQRQLAERAACSVSAVKKIESDTRRPSRQLAEALADALAIPEEERELFLLSARGQLPVDKMPFASQPLAPAAEEFVLASGTAGNLPAAVGPLFGRDEEVVRLVDQLTSGDTRLITLVGLGGVGKSRLALEAARRVQEQFRDGAWFVPLAGVNDHAKLSTAVAVALGLNFAGPLDPEQQLIRGLGDGRMLLLLDNFEQLLPAGAEMIASLIQGAPGITLLVTSRERLRLQAEMTVSVDGLRHEAARALFVDRAARAGVGLTPDQAEDTSRAIDGICRLVGGLPLALELAAAWVRLLSPAEILADLQNSHDLLIGSQRDIPERHRSVLAVFDASWARLSPDVQNLLAGLSVFAGSFTREAAESVCGATLPQLATLHDHSLLQRHKERFRLHELIRQMATGKLVELPDEEATVRDRHSAFYAGFLGRISGLFKTGGPQMAGWDLAIDRELDNIRFAWQWAIKNDQPQRLLPAALSLYVYQDFRGQAQEGVQMSAGLAASAIRVRAKGSGDDDALRRTLAMALLGQASLGLRAGQLTEGREILEQAYALLDGLDAPDERVGLIGLLGPVALLTMNDQTGQEALEASLILARRERHAWGWPLALNFLGLFRLIQGDLTGAKEALDEAVSLWADQPGLAWCKERSMVHLGLTYHAAGDTEKAQSVQEEALRLARDIGDHAFVPLSMCHLAFHHYAQGQLTPAKSDFMAGLVEAQHFGLLPSVRHGVAGLGLVAAAEGEASRAVTLLTLGLAPPGTYIMFLLGEPQRVLAELQVELPPAEFAAAEDRAREMDSDELLAWLQEWDANRQTLQD